PMSVLTRREFLIAANAGAAAVVAGRMSPQAAYAAQAAKAVGFTLPPLPYAYDALEPHIDVETMMIHHDKHHQAYVTNLNKALEGNTTLLSMSISALMLNLKAVPEAIRTA